MAVPGPDRRRWPRVKTGAGVKTGDRNGSSAMYSLLSDPIKVKKKASVLDLSTRGMRIATDEELPVGGTVEVVMYEPSQGNRKLDTEDLAFYRLLAEVRWGKHLQQDKYMHGLELLDITTVEPRNRKALRRLMAKLDAGVASKQEEE